MLEKYGEAEEDLRAQPRIVSYQIYLDFLILTNTFLILDKYILNVGEIRRGRRRLTRPSVPSQLSPCVSLDCPNLRQVHSFH